MNAPIKSVIRSKTFALTALALPLALGLAACGSGDDAEASISGEPVAEVSAPDGQVWSEMAQKTDRGGYLVGNPDAPIKLVEYGSLTCPACAAFSMQASEPLMNDYVDSGRVNFEFRSFVIHGPLDLALTRLVDCGTPEQAVPLADQVWANLPTIMQPFPPTLRPGSAPAGGLGRLPPSCQVILMPLGQTLVAGNWKVITDHLG